jgi:hypothetical protein
VFSVGVAPKKGMNKVNDGVSDGAESAAGDATTSDSVGETTVARSTSEAESEAPEATQAPAPTEPLSTGPPVPMAVVGLDSKGELITRSDAGESNERVRVRALGQSV